MKRLIASVLALVLCFGLLAGCGEDEPQATTPVAEPSETQPAATEPVVEDDTAAEDVKSAAAYLKAMYKEMEPGTPYDFERLGVVRVANVPYTVVWTADTEHVVAVDNGDGTVTIDVNENVTEETKYVLTATVSDEKGNSASVSFDHYIPASLGDAAEILELAYALEAGASLDTPVTLTGVITAIDTPYDAGYKNVSVVMAVVGHEDKPILCYRLKGEGAENLFPGDTITVSGIIKNYKGTIEFDAGCTLINVVKGENTFELPTDPSEIVKMAYELKPGESIPVQVTLTGMIGYMKTPYSEAYGNVTPIIIVEGDWARPITCFRMKGAGADRIWKYDTITVTGTIKNYQGTIEFDAGCIMDSWENTGSDVPVMYTADEILAQAAKLKTGETMQGTHSLSGQVVKVNSPYDPMYGNETITIRVPLEGGKYKDVQCYRIFTGAQNIEAGDYVTIRGSLMNYKGAVQFASGSYTTKLDRTTLAEAIAEASKLNNNQALPYEKSMTGTVKIDTPYSSQHGNITFTLTDAEGNSVKCYRVKGINLDLLVDGDVVTVTGKMIGYDKAAQFNYTATVMFERGLPTDLAGQIAAAKKLPSKSYLPMESVATGIVTKVEEPYSSFKNMTFYVTTEDGVEAYCFRLTDPDVATLKLGDKVTVTGKLYNYKGVVEFDKTAKLEILETGSEEPTTPPETEPFPATLAEQIAAVKKLTDGSYLNGTSTITGTVDEIFEPYTDEFKNITFFVTNSDGIRLQIHRVKGFTGIETLAVGDTVTVTGSLLNYGGDAQFDKNATVTVDAKAPVESEPTTPPTSEPTTPSEPEPTTPSEPDPTTPSEPAAPVEKTVTYTFNFAKADSKNISNADLKSAFVNSTLAATSATVTDKVYAGNPSNGAFQGTNFLRFSSSKANGSCSVTFPSNVKITKVVVNSHSWTTGEASTLSINGISNTPSKTGTAADMTYVLSTPSNVLNFAATKRCFVFAVTLFYTEG